MASLTGLFKPEPEEDRSDDKLVDLFRNRVELKKEFAALRNEKYELQDRIKEHRGSIERVEQKLQHLESLLLDPEWVHTVVVFYQLRSLNRRCQGKLAKFAEQLKQQRENRRRELQLQRWREKRAAHKADIEKELGSHREQLQLLEQALSDTTMPTLVCMHHQPVNVESAWIDTMAIENAEALFDIIDRHQQVKGLLWGHVHQTFEATRLGVRLMASPSTCVQFALDTLGLPVVCSIVDPANDASIRVAERIHAVQSSFVNQRP